MPYNLYIVSVQTLNHAQSINQASTGNEAVGLQFV